MLATESHLVFPHLAEWGCSPPPTVGSGESPGFEVGCRLLGNRAWVRDCVRQGMDVEAKNSFASAEGKDLFGQVRGLHGLALPCLNVHSDWGEAQAAAGQPLFTEPATAAPFSPVPLPPAHSRARLHSSCSADSWGVTGDHPGLCETQGTPPQLACTGQGPVLGISTYVAPLHLTTLPGGD